MNKCFFSGRNIKDVELTFTGSGTAIAKFTLSIKSKKKDEATGKYLTMLLNFEAWGKVAEHITNYFGEKGDVLCVSGRVEVDKWEDKETHKNREKYKIVVDDLDFDASHKKNNNMSGQMQNNSFNDATLASDNEIPF